MKNTILMLILFITSVVGYSQSNLPTPDTIIYSTEYFHYEYHYQDTVIAVSSKDYSIDMRLNEKKGLKNLIRQSEGILTIQGVDYDIVDTWPDTISRLGRAVWVELDQIPPGYESPYIHMVKPKHAGEEDDVFIWKDRKHGNIKRPAQFNNRGKSRLQEIKSDVSAIKSRKLNRQ